MFFRIDFQTHPFTNLHATTLDFIEILFSSLDLFSASHRCRCMVFQIHTHRGEIISYVDDIIKINHAHMQMYDIMCQMILLRSIF